eukprot:2069969-Amphidinium_carterae.1
MTRHGQEELQPRNSKHRGISFNVVFAHQGVGFETMTHCQPRQVVAAARLVVAAAEPTPLPTDRMV